MQQSSTYAKDDYVNPNTILGKIGGTGPTGPKSYEDHLHYDIFTNDYAYHSKSTLSMVLGNKNTWGTQVVSESKTKHTYNPNLYYKNSLGNGLRLK